MHQARRTASLLASGDIPSPQLTKEAEQLEEGWLLEVADRIEGMTDLFVTMHETVQPAFFFQRIRPYLSGWMNNPTLPDGVVYQVSIPVCRTAWGLGLGG